MPLLTSSLPFSPAELAYLHTSLSSTPALRPDARQETEFRPLRAETGVLPAVNGSAHVGFSDGREAIVGVKLEVEKTPGASVAARKEDDDSDDGSMELDVDVDSDKNKNKNDKQKTRRGNKDWITLSLTLPGLRDDDATLYFLEEMLREPLAASEFLADSLAINSRWHWRLYIDVVLISPGDGLAGFPLPLLSMATHLALRDTRVPRLQSEGEEDPVADDDWMASSYLYPRRNENLSSGGGGGGGPKPPITLLVIVVGGNVTFDPSREELAVADAIIAVSVGTSTATANTTTTNPTHDEQNSNEFQILATRMLDPPARDTMKGVPMAAGANGAHDEGTEVPGVWRPRVGGVDRKLLKLAVNSVIGSGVARDVMHGLDGFLDVETRTGSGAAT